MTKKAQNKKLLEFLLRGRSINFIQARSMGIAYLNSRLSDLRKQGVKIKAEWIKIGETHCKKYQLEKKFVH